ncbi:hypothetical protein BD311DRAFT_762574 [Dichomitus squalens]|uniref:Uncharacterized protein n=1 Tax=Dichomitus squalens TaxID=114155 RepID=A0A4Q9MD80_9APHY|nr:hypothetical protein BD311DRAFT_769279 [Dichomitus squalens]TBU23671.1 hypothetical protein BD311DRAFT_768032 [Dichomitus squalens]TBU26401.1 hypothetical protein BD311DRAFT_762574 [Dichomitus squalens]
MPSHCLSHSVLTIQCHYLLSSAVKTQTPRPSASALVLYSTTSECKYRNLKSRSCAAG